MKNTLQTIDWSSIPAPSDDGGAAHLKGMTVPSVSLPGTHGAPVDLSALKGLTVVYAYPKTGRPDVALPENWDMIPGARGCTPQSCAFRDHHAELKALGVDHLFGLSTQSTEWQAEAAERLNLPFPLLSDAEQKLAEALRFPAFEAEGEVLLKRLTMIIRDGVIEDVIYPVFPPDQNAEIVIARLKAS